MKKGKYGKEEKKEEKETERYGQGWREAEEYCNKMRKHRKRWRGIEGNGERMKDIKVRKCWENRKLEEFDK